MKIGEAKVGQNVRVVNSNGEDAEGVVYRIEELTHRDSVAHLSYVQRESGRRVSGGALDVSVLEAV